MPLAVAVILGVVTVNLYAQKPGDYRARRTPGGAGSAGELHEPQRGRDADGTSRRIHRQEQSDFSREELTGITKTLARTINAFLGPTEAPDNWWQPAYGDFVAKGSTASRVS